MEWLRAVFHPSTCAEEGYAAIAEAVAQSPRGAGGVLYLPWLAGERSPVSDPNARACFLGISPGTTQADLHRAVLEGVALGFRLLKETAFPDLTSLRVLGGAAQSDAWMQIMADVLGCQLQVVADPVNAAARGVATLAFHHLRWMPLDQAADALLTTTAFFPDPSAAHVYDRLFDVFRGAHSALGPLFSQLADFRCNAVAEVL